MNISRLSRPPRKDPEGLTPKVDESMVLKVAGVMLPVHWRAGGQSLRAAAQQINPEAQSGALDPDEIVLELIPEGRPEVAINSSKNWGSDLDFEWEGHFPGDSVGRVDPSEASSQYREL